MSRTRTYAAVKDSFLSTPANPRYVIIDLKTGNILDDAGGYGYKTAQKAHIGYSMKLKKQKEEENK